MTDIEKVQNGAILQLFTALQVDKIPLKMQLANDDDMRLTHITDIRKRKGTLHFLVNSPEDFPKLSEDADQSLLWFEFIDKENIKYAFETTNWKFSRAMIWVRFPEFVHRYQRRRLFRLEAPHGTRLYFKVDDIRYKLLVINVSLGGTLGVLVSVTKQMEQELKKYDSKMLEHIELLFPPQDRKKTGSIIYIKRCQIIRQEKNPVTGKFELAIEFKEISAEEQENFSDLFYKWQREYLRKRRFMRA